MLQGIWLENTGELTNINNTYNSYQSKVEDLVDVNLQEVLDITHDYKNKIRSFIATCNKKIGGLQATDGENMELKLQQISEKHAQRIARTTDDMDTKMKAGMQKMNNKYEMYSQSMTQ